MAKAPISKGQTQCITIRFNLIQELFKTAKSDFHSEKHSMFLFDSIYELCYPQKLCFLVPKMVDYSKSITRNHNFNWADFSPPILSITVLLSKSVAK